MTKIKFNCICGVYETSKYKLKKIENVEECIWNEKPNSTKYKRINVYRYSATCPICKNETILIIKEDIC